MEWKDLIKSKGLMTIAVLSPYNGRRIQVSEAKQIE